MGDLMKKRRLKKTKIMQLIFKTLVLFVIIFLLVVGYRYFQGNNNIEAYENPKLNIQHQFLSVNPYSRPAKELRHIRGIVVHYTANPGSTAQNNRDYFESLKYKQETSVSSHFVIGIDGEIIQCIPLNEIAYASNNRNSDTISIECCHPDESGKFSEETYRSLVDLVSSLKKDYNLDKEDIIRHYDVTGKICPKYFVEHEDAWLTFLDSID